MNSFASSLIVLASCVTLAFGQESPNGRGPGSRPSNQSWQNRENQKERFDKNQDGKLGTREREHAKDEMTRERHMRESFLRFREEHPNLAKKLMENADKDGDGKVSLEERKAAYAKFREFEKKRWEELQKEHPEAAERMKERADRNDDGKVDSFEKFEAMRRRGELSELQELRREKFDKDGDGRIKGDERLAEKKWLEDKRQERREDRCEERKDRANDNCKDGQRGQGEGERSKPQDRPAPKPRPMGGR